MIETSTLTVSHQPWLKRIARIFLVLVVVLAFGGFLYQNISEARDRRFNPMPGRRVRLEQSTMYMHID
jgi:hypothetical protein